MCFHQWTPSSNIMAQNGCNQDQSKVRIVAICSSLKQLTHWAAHMTCKNQEWQQMFFIFSLPCMVVFFLLGATNTLGSKHKVQECQMMPLYFLACVSLLINTIKQYNARKSVQIGPAQGIVVFSCLEQLTHWAALTGCKNANWCLYIYLPVCFY